MNFEVNRLNTFTDWPASAPVDPIRIAKAGFFYSGDGMEVQCFSCEGKISQWNYGDQVMWRHRQLKPNCTFVVNPHLSGNIPLVIGPECTSSDNTATSWSPTDEVQPETLHTSQDYGLTEEDEMYKSDALRLLSFINWEDSSVSREALVNAGFYHAGEGRLRCAWCGGELAPFRRFGSLGQPLEVHRMYFPRCAHAVGLEAAQQMTTVSPPSSPPANTPPLRSPDNRDNLPQSSGAAHNEALLAAGRRLRSLGVVGGGARRPQYAALQARLLSFRRWPADRSQTPRALAEAGFYHTGTDDQVRCYYCDGGLGKWEAGDAPWAEHARWFPHCGLVLLTKGQEFVDTCRLPNTVSKDGTLNSKRRNTDSEAPVSTSQVEQCMESSIVLAALSAGLDAARVRRAVTRRLRTAGVPFSTSEALIDAVLDEQLSEEAWSVTPALRDSLADTLLGLLPASQLRWDERVPSPPPRSPSPVTITQNNVQTPHETDPTSISNETRKAAENTEKDDVATDVKHISLEEENRQLKEARLCKVCMDSEVSVVFLPCGHLVSCARCGAALAACPLCRASVKALVRAYLA